MPTSPTPEQQARELAADICEQILRSYDAKQDGEQSLRAITPLILAALAAAEARGAAQQAESRSVQRRKAIMRGEPTPTFDTPSPDFTRGRAAGLREAAGVVEAAYTREAGVSKLRALATEADQ